MKKLIFILFVVIIAWVLLQFYEVEASEKMTNRVIPYLNDIQIAPVEKRMLLVSEM